MKPANLERLKDKIIRPDFDKHLVPLMLYRGGNTPEAFGKMSRAWNFAVTMMESEVENFSQAAKLSANPDFAHLCGPRRPLLYNNFSSLFGRLRDHPRVTDNIPGLTEYVRSVEGPKHRLVRVPLYTNDFRKRGGVAPWRIIGFSPEEQAAREARWAEKIQKRVAQHAIKESARALRLITRQELREIREAEKAALATQIHAAKTRERILAKESKDRLFYPYLIHKPVDGDSERALLLEVNNAVPKHLPDFLRADICQDLIVAILSGEIKREDLQDNVRGFTGKVFKLHPLKYGPLSLDAKLLSDGDDNRTLKDVIAPAREYW